MKLKVCVYNEKKEKIFCKINLFKSLSNTKNTAYNHIETVYCNGEYEFELAAGEYKIEVYKGNLYVPVKETAEIKDKDVVLEVCLKELVDVKSLHLYSFDAHSHISRSERLETGNLGHASTVVQGEDFNFFFAGSPYDHETHMQDRNKSYDEKVSYREKFSKVIQAVNNNNYILDIGNEIVKGRYGHMFLMNYDQMPPFSQYYDRAWGNGPTGR